MVRNYQEGRLIPAEVRDRLLANAQRAPSAGFSQGWAFLVLEDQADRERFWATTTADAPPDEWSTALRRAPLLIVAFSHKQA